MSGITVEGTIRFPRQGRSGRRELEEGDAPSAPPSGRIPKITRLMALAIRLDELIREGSFANYADLAQLYGVTRNRLTHVMNLLLLAPEIQEALLFLPHVSRGADPLHLKDLQPCTRQCDWTIQRKTLREIGELHF